MVRDQLHRPLGVLRLSLTARCNLACPYCLPDGHDPPGLLSHEQRLMVIEAAVALGARRLRLTGGEPLLHGGVEALIAAARPLGLHDIALTSNGGLLLSRLAEPLRAAGLDRVNVSLDTFDAERFAEVTRGGTLARVLDGIHTARRVFSRVKLNAVLLRGVNSEDLPRFVEFSDQYGIEVRFIELMPIFGEKDYFHRHFFSVSEAQDALARAGIHLEPEGSAGPAEGNRTGYGPATTYAVQGSTARVGFISQMSSTKCLSCNKLRLTSDGALKPCLLSPNEIDLAPAIHRRDRAAIADAMRQQFLERAERYDLVEALNDPFRRGMQATGG